LADETEETAERPTTVSTISPTPRVDETARGQRFQLFADTVEMSVWQLMYMLSEQRHRPKPHGDWIFIPLALCVGLFIALAQGNFTKSVLTLDPDRVYAAAAVAFAVSLVIMVGLAIRWVVIRLRYPQEPPETAFARMTAEGDALKAVIDKASTKR
jgi:hypothetical protein